MASAVANLLQAWGWKGQPWRLSPWARADHRASMAEWREFRERAKEVLPDTLPEEEIQAQMKEFFDA